MKKVFSIGRDPSSDIVLYDVSNVVSRAHATLRVDGKKWYIIDHSTNGTYRNGIRLTPNVEYRVTKDDEVSFGDTVRLDWDAVPGLKKTFPSIWLYLPIILLAAMLAACLFWLIPKYRNSSESSPVLQTTVNIDSTKIAPRADSLVVLKNVKGKVSKDKEGSKVKSSNSNNKSVSQKEMDKYEDEDNKSIDPLL